MHEEMKKIGEIFKAKRQELNLTVKEIEHSTSIRSSYIKAIEEGHVDQFLSSVYILGFIKQYALFLGLNFDQMVKNHPNAFNLPGEKHEFSYGIGTVEVRSSMGGGVKWFPNLLWAILGAGILVFAWYLAKSLGVI